MTSTLHSTSLSVTVYSHWFYSQSRGVLLIVASDASVRTVTRFAPRIGFPRDPCPHPRVALATQRRQLTNGVSRPANLAHVIGTCARIIELSGETIHSAAGTGTSQQAEEGSQVFCYRPNALKPSAPKPASL